MNYTNFDKLALEIVNNYILKHLDKSEEIPKFKLFIEEKNEILQNKKWLVSSTLLNGLTYEVTYNGKLKKFYLDVRKKIKSSSIDLDEVKYLISGGCIK